MVIQQEMMVSRWRATKPLPNSVLSVCLHFGGTINETAAEDTVEKDDYCGGGGPQLELYKVVVEGRGSTEDMP